MKKIVLSLFLILLLPFGVEAEDGGVLVNETPQVLYMDSGSTGELVMDFEISNFTASEESLDLSLLSLVCYNTESIGKFTLKQGSGVLAESSNLTYNNETSLIDFTDLELGLDFGETQEIQVLVDIEEEAPRHIFSCSLAEMILESASQECDSDLQGLTLSTSNLALVNYGDEHYVYATSFEAWSDLILEKHNELDLEFNQDDTWLYTFQFMVNRAVVLEDVFLECNDASALDELYLKINGGEHYADFEYGDNYLSGLTYARNKMYIFQDLGIAVDGNLKVEVFANTGETNMSDYQAECNVLDYHLERQEVSNEDTYSPDVDLPYASYEDPVMTSFEENPFPDTKLSDLEGKAAAELYRRQVINGFADGQFKGGELVNRAQAAKFLLLARYGSIDESKANNGMFSDIENGKWYTPYVVTAAELGIINGYDDGTFQPARTVNTAEFLKMLTLTFELPQGTEYMFEDVPTTAWYAWYAGSAYKYSLFPSRVFYLFPGAELSRNEVAVAIYQYFLNR